MGKCENACIPLVQPSHNDDMRSDIRCFVPDIARFNMLSVGVNLFVPAFRIECFQHWIISNVRCEHFCQYAVERRRINNATSFLCVLFCARSRFRFLSILDQHIFLYKYVFISIQLDFCPPMTIHSNVLVRINQVPLKVCSRNLILLLEIHKNSPLQAKVVLIGNFLFFSRGLTKQFWTVAHFIYLRLLRKWQTYAQNEKTASINMRGSYYGDASRGKRF